MQTLENQKLGPFKIMSKISITSYKLLLPDGCRLHPVFHCDLFSHSTTYISLRPHQAKIEGDVEEYSINYIVLMMKLILGCGREVLTCNF